METMPTPKNATLTSIASSPVFPRSGIYSSSNPVTNFVIYALAMADVVEEMYGVPVAVTLSQAITESKAKGSNVPGSSWLTRNHKNWFGVKDHGWGKGSVAVDTGEHINGKYVIMQKEKFRSYPSNVAGWNDYGHFLRSNPRYAAAFKTTDPAKFVQAIADAGYATGPYATLLKKMLPTTLKRIALVRKAADSI